MVTIQEANYKVSHSASSLQQVDWVGHAVGSQDGKVMASAASAASCLT